MITFNLAQEMDAGTSQYRLPPNADSFGVAGRILRERRAVLKMEI
jgi:hypothetical protein